MPFGPLSAKLAMRYPPRPLVFHSPRPGYGPEAWKSAPGMAAGSPGLPEPVPFTTSLTSFVPAYVPLVRQSSRPELGALAEK